MFELIGTFDHTNRIKLGWYSGLLSNILSVSTIIISSMVVQDYDQFTDTISKLATHGALWIFLIGMGLSAILSLLYFAFFIPSLGQDQLLNYSSSTGVLASICLFFIAIFPTEGITEGPHLVFAVLFFIIITFSIYFLVRYLQNTKFIPKSLIIFGYFVVLFLMIFWFIFLIDKSSGAIMQKIVVGLITLMNLLVLYFFREIRKSGQLN